MKSKKNIYLMYAIVLLQGMVFYGPIATLYRQVSGVTVFQITLIESISYLLCILLEIPWGILADKIGYKKTMCFCSCLYLVSKIVFWTAGGFWDFMLERIMLSVVVAGLSGVDTSILYLSCGKGESQKVFGVYNSLGFIGLLFASFVFSAFVGTNYSAAAFLTVVSYGAAAVLSLFLDEVKSEETRAFRFADVKAVFTGIIQNKRFLLLLISVAFLSQTHQTITVFLNQVQYEACGLSPSGMGYIYIIVTLAGLLGAFSQKFTRSLGQKRTGRVLYVAAMGACILLGFADTAVFSVLGILFLRVVDSLYQPYQMELQNKQVRSANRATELSVYAMVVNCVSAGTSVLFGTLADIGIKTAFFFGAGICLMGLLCYCVWCGRKKNGE